jgi:hypothetical protein
MKSGRENLILLRAYNPSKNPECRICPIRDESGNTLTGQGTAGYFEALTEKELRSLERTGALVSPTTVKKIYNDYIIRLDTPTGKAEWDWMQHHPFIDAERTDDTVKDKASLFYVHDEQREAELHVSKTKKQTILLAEIFQMSLDEKRTLYAALGMGSAAILSDEMLEVALERKLGADLPIVQKVMDSRKELGSKDTEARKLFYDAINHRVIEAQSSGMITYGGVEGEPLGRAEQDVVEFLLLPVNGSTVVAIQEEVNKLENS